MGSIIKSESNSLVGLGPTKDAESKSPIRIAPIKDSKSSCLISRGAILDPESDEIKSPNKRNHTSTISPQTRTLWSSRSLIFTTLKIGHSFHEHLKIAALNNNEVKHANESSGNRG